MKILVAEHCGFCSGVKKAVDTALSVPPENTYVLGELIHNEDVTSRIRARGLIVVERLDEVPDGATLLIRSHGVGKAVYAACEARGIRVVDCTCSFVRHTQKLVEEASASGRTVVIAGHREHPEVVGLVGWCSGEALVFDSAQEDFSVLEGKDVVLVSQTTFSVQRFSKIAENLQKVRPKTVEIFQTICYTTVCRQKETERIAKQSDAMLVIGGLNSSNTNKLGEIASLYCGRVFRLKNADDFEYEKIKNFKRVGVVAGASTPDWLTSEVLSKMAENNTEVQNETVAEAQAPVAEETVKAEVEAAPQAEAIAEAADEKPTMAKVIENIDRKTQWVKGAQTAPDGTVSGQRTFAANELPVHSIREGEVPGIHSIRYDSEADSITITHDAKNRRGFALGAVLAAEYTATHEGYLGMADLFPFLK